MNQMSTPEIQVIGGGFIGLAFALAAHQRGMSVAVADRGAAPVEPAGLAANVIAMNPRSTDLMKSLGVWSNLPPEFAVPYHAMSVIDAQGTGAISFDAADEAVTQDYLGHIVDQRALRWALFRTLEDAGLAVNWQTSLDVEAISPGLLVAADGAHSETREVFGFKKLSYPYGQSATVFTARFASPHEQSAYQWFTASGPLALLPLHEPHTVAVVWSGFDDRSGQEETSLALDLQATTEDLLGAVTNLGARFSFPLMQQHALSYVKPGVVLLGDAAHTIHPLAGQGANLGFADVQCLIAEISAARLEGRQPFDIRVLRRFETTRRRENQAAALAMEGFHRLFTARQPLIGLMRSHGLRFVHENKTLKRLAISVASGRV